MCVILIPEKKHPSREIIEKCNSKNPDGCSVSWLNKRGKAQYIKGLKVEELLKIIPDLEFPYVLHFRYASPGMPINPLFTHPFEVNEESPLRFKGETKKLLIHNGTIKEYEWLLAGAGIDLEKDELMSDTRAIAKVISKNNEKLLWKLPGNFVLVDSVKDKIRMVGDWIHDNGIHYSNMKWKYSGSSSSVNHSSNSYIGGSGCCGTTGTNTIIKVGNRLVIFLTLLLNVMRKRFLFKAKAILKI